jgi:hypothetical protein
VDASTLRRDGSTAPAVLTCQHVACPWLFPNYFADKWDWLQHVSEEFVRHSLQLLEVDARGPLVSPKVLLDLPLDQRVWIHGERDVAMLELADDHALEAPEASKLLYLVTLLSGDCAAGDSLLFTGHQQFQEEDVLNAGQELLRAMEMIGQYPKEVGGQFVGKSSRGQAFARSEQVLEEGMCGGAVLNSEGEGVGLIEGIVPPSTPAAVIPSSASASEQEAIRETWKMQKALANHVAFIPSDELAEFVAEPFDMLLTGTALGDDNDDEVW